MARGLGTCALALAAATAIVSVTHAGGFERGTADTDILFEEGNFVARFGVTYVTPKQNINSNATPADPLAPLPPRAPSIPQSGDILPSYSIPSLAAKIDLGDQVSCAGTYTTPFGAISDYSDTTAGFDTSSPTATVSQEFKIHEFGATCAFFHDTEMGRFSIIGGAFYQDLDFEQLIAFSPLAGGPTGAFRLDDQSWGYRVGAAYERPEIALRARLMYRSAVTVDATGSVDPLVGGGPAAPTAVGSAVFPQSLELDVQSGIAPGWLAFAGVKWTDWSVFDVLEYNAGAVTGGDTSLNFFWRDGWTINGGVAHQFNESLVATVGLTWDRGVGTGFDLQNSDTWTVSAGGAYTPHEQFRISGGIGFSWFGETSKNFLDRFMGGVGEVDPAPGIQRADAGHAISGNLSAMIKF